MDDKIKNTQNYYDGISSGYKQLYHEEQINKINKVKKYLNSFGLILDLGSGDGVLNKFLKFKSKNSNNNNNNDNYDNDLNNKQILISFDLSFELLKLNDNKDNCKILGNIVNLPFKNNSFDKIFAFTIIQDLPFKKIEISILGIKRILKKNGILIISFLKISSKSELILYILKREFEIINFEEELKDYIYICRN